MKLKRRRFVKLLAMLMALLLFAACAKDKKPPASNDPNLGLWQAAVVEMFGEESPAVPKKMAEFGSGAKAGRIKR